MKKVFVNLRLSDEQKQRLESVSDKLEFVYSADPSANIIIGNYHPDRLKGFTDLEWIQTSAVGIDAYIKKGILADGVILTNAVDVHTVEVAEHVFATALSMVKNLHLYRDDQAAHHWKDEGKVKGFKDLRVTIVGLGNIGRHAAGLFKAVGAHVTGVKRTVREKPDCVDELYPQEDLLKAVSDADVVVAVVPGNKANEDLFDRKVFEAMKDDTILINAGRGNLYEEDLLVEALEKKMIRAAGVDVFRKEPVDPDSVLWDMRDLVMTPHAAGSFHMDSAFEAFLDLAEDNLRRYANGEELLNVVKERE